EAGRQIKGAGLHYTARGGVPLPENKRGFQKRLAGIRKNRSRFFKNAQLRPIHVFVFGIKAYTCLHKEGNHGTLLAGFAYSNRPRVSCPPGIPSGPRRMLPGVGTLGAKLVAPATRNGVHRTVASWRWP